MARYFGSLVCCGVIACAAPLAASPGPVDGTETTVAVHRMSTFSSRLSEEAVMVLAGTALIGLAAAVRRAA